ncbi:MAG: GAF domain-containing protein [Deltaproteobacteria bacterium]|nr:GAF domain-containing protein [Deltaproteobacteria bacterium]
MTETFFSQPGELRRLVEFSALLNSSFDIQTVLTRAMDYVEGLLGAEASSIFQVDQVRGDLFFRLVRGEKADQLREMRLNFGEGIAGAVALSEEPLLISDTSRDPRFCRRFDNSSGFATRSVLCAPLKSRDRLVGVMEVLNKRDPRGFDEQDRDVLLLVGNLIGTALENARLYGRLQERLSATMEELETAQAKLLRARRLAALGKLAQGVAHEVRNPVAIIGGFLRRLGKRPPPHALAQTEVELMTSQVQKLERMVGEIEAFARLGEPAKRPVHLLDLVEEVLALQEPALRRQQIRVQRDFPPAVPTVPADPDLLRVALGHLLENAREAMPAGGLLQIALSLEPQRVHLAIKDTGMGVAPADLSHVFDPFFSSKPQGTGMGLTVVHQIIANHLGEVQLESTPGQGVTVHLWLPRSTPGD